MRQPVFTLPYHEYRSNAAVKNSYLRNYIAQPVFSHHILQCFICIFTNLICFRISHSINCNHIIDTIAHDTIMDTFPNKLHFTAPVHTVFEIADTYKAVLLWCIIWNNSVFHITRPPILFEFWCVIWIIDCRSRLWMLSWIIPCNGMIVWICMTCVRPAMIGIMPLHNCTPILADFRVYPITVFECPFNFTRLSNVSTIGRFVWIRSPSSAAFEYASTHQEWFYYITFRAICLSDHIIFQIFFSESLLRIQIPPRTALVIHINNISFHFRKRRMIADDSLRLNSPQHFPVACQKPFFLIAAVIMCRRHVGRYGNKASFFNSFKAEVECRLIAPIDCRDNTQTL